jgi:anthranilate synthase component 2
MILLIDNYDSFSYNLYQMLGALEQQRRVRKQPLSDSLDCRNKSGNDGREMISALERPAGAPAEPSIRVVRNDEMNVAAIEALAPSHIVISPGPGRPEDSGVCPEVIRAFAGRTPLLGVCLGHQALCQVFGATITYAGQLMHGKASEVALDTSSPLFEGLPERIEVARYHSLVAAPHTIPPTLWVTARTADGEVMAVERVAEAPGEVPAFGVQFHPESILTPQGVHILNNFLRVGGGR